MSAIPNQAQESESFAIDGITYARQPNTLYAPLREASERLGLSLVWQTDPPLHQLEGRPLDRNLLKTLPTGRTVLPVRELSAYGVAVSWDGDQEAARLEKGESALLVRRSPKRVAINLREQRLRAWEGERLVLDTRISSGRRGHRTPKGTFRAGPLKTPMLISRKYGDAKMPWSVQVRGDVVIHGFPSVPRFAASHGCVRMPLTGYNPARWFYRWVTVGTPIVIGNEWPAAKKQREQAAQR